MHTEYTARVPLWTVAFLRTMEAFCAVTGSPSSLVRKKINAQVAVMPDGEIQTVGAPSLKKRT